MNFPTNGRQKSSINRLLEKFRDINTVKRLTGSGRRRSAWSEEIVDLANNLVRSQKDTSPTHRTAFEILIIN